MIKHHPSFELIHSFVKGDLPASLAMGIAMHAEMCPVCQGKIMQLTEQIAELSFENDIDSKTKFTDLNENNIVNTSDIDFESMIDEITSSTEIMEAVKPINQSISFKHNTYTLPSALGHIDFTKPTSIGKLSRSRLLLDEDEIHSSLLHINAGGGVPEHTHKGFELTLLLDGAFSDEKGHYVKGDFIMLDASVKHNPISLEGCLCYTVANDSLQFTQGINKLLNPIGNFIY
jgi:putative transcriptional regulator